MLVDLSKLVDAFSVGATDRLQPWIPPEGENPASVDVAALLMFVLAATGLVVAFEFVESHTQRERLRRYSLARHRFLRAPFYRLFD